MFKARVFRSFVLAVLSCSLLTSCAKKRVSVGTDPVTDPPRTIGDTNNTSTTLVRLVTLRPVIAGAVEKIINTDSSCVQWVKRTEKDVTTEWLEYHRAACATDDTPLNGETLAFSTSLGKSETSAGEVQTIELLFATEEGSKPVGQLQMSPSTGARLEELCQFTNTTTGKAPFAEQCLVTATDTTWDTLTMSPVTSPRTVSKFEPPPESVPYVDTEEEYNYED